MPAYLKKTKSEILNQALTKLQKNTTITAIHPGSIARALTEAVTSELGDMYDIMDFNTNQTMLTTATGSALDMLGILYNVQRKRISELAQIDKRLGSFIFYLNAPHNADIVIPKGTNIYTDASSYLGQRFSYSTTDDNIIPTGRTRIYASIQPNFTDTVSTAGVDTLVVHDFPSPNGVTVRCTNPKQISPTNTLESDDQFRLRMIKEIRVSSSGTLEAVRFAGLKVNGVRDVRIRQAPYGMGSFEAIVVPERTNNATQVVERAVAFMDNVRPLGVRMFTKSPVPLPFALNIDIIAPTAVSNQAQDTVVKKASVGISRYINSLLPGSEFVYNQFLQMIMDASEMIKDVVITKFSVNGKEVMRRNYRPAEDEQIVVGDISVKLARA